ncbi:MAG: histidine phosphatase family protein [Bacteroidetes bacterium]|nr:histidine phosphatase family protein [Bacteroidota bacterium]
MSKIYLIRHAQASFLSDDYDNLSNKGILQSEVLGRYFVEKNIHFDKIFIGKLKRHQQTFDGFNKAFITEGIELPKPIYLKELNEHQVPEALSLAYDDFVNQYDEAKKMFEEIERDPNLKRKNSIKIFGLFLKEYATGRYAFEHESIQSWAQFRMQAKKGIASILERTGKGETVGIFTSGGTKSSIIGDSLGISEEKISELNLAILNASFSQLLYSKNRLNVLSLNETPHLPKELITFV